MRVVSNYELAVDVRLIATAMVNFIELLDVTDFTNSVISDYGVDHVVAVATSRLDFDY